VAATAGNSSSVLITDEKLSRFARAMRDFLRQGDIAFHRAYIRLFVDEIVRSDSEISLSGPKDAPAKSASIGTLPPSGDSMPSFVRKWRAICDESNNWNALRLLDFSGMR